MTVPQILKSTHAVQHNNNNNETKTESKTVQIFVKKSKLQKERGTLDPLYNEP